MNLIRCGESLRHKAKPSTLSEEGKFLSKKNRRLQLGHKIIQSRRILDLSQADVADRLGICRSTLSHWETGARVPSYSKMRRLAEVLGEDPGFLMFGERRSERGLGDQASGANVETGTKAQVILSRPYVPEEQRPEAIVNCHNCEAKIAVHVFTAVSLGVIDDPK